MEKFSTSIKNQTLTKLSSSKQKENYIISILRIKKGWRIPALILSLLGVVVGLAGLGYIWFWIIPLVWKWGFITLSFKAIPAVFALFFLATLPIWLPIVPASIAKNILGLYIEEQESEIKQKVQEVKEVQTDLESQLEKEDTTGLIPLIRYSRVQLEAYYTIGLSQTQRSFRYSVIAMWIGFIIIGGGIIHYIVPLEQFGINPVGADINVLIIAGGGIIELISALFLWVYRNSIAQLTYFYNRQMHTHNILMCYRIANTMDKQDDTKRHIVEKVLERTWVLERPATLGAKGISKLFSRGA